MEIISVTKNGNKTEFGIDALRFMRTLSYHDDYVNPEDQKLYIYYNLAYNVLYAAIPQNLETFMGWPKSQPVSVVNWARTFNDGTGYCISNYLKWLNQNLPAYTLLYGKLDLWGDVSQVGHIITDVRFNATKSICIGIYKKNIPLMGFLPRVTKDLSTVLQGSKHIELKDYKLYYK